MLLELLHPLSAVDLEVDGAKDDENAEDPDGRDGVAVDEAGEEDGHGLPQGADDDEHDGAELGYRVENKELKEEKACHSLISGHLDKNIFHNQIQSYYPIRKCTFLSERKNW